MQAHLLESDLVWADPEANIKHFDALIGSLPDADLYVLPEMFTTGFATEPEGIAEEESSCIGLQWMRSVARSRNCAVAGSIALHSGDRYLNRFYFVTPDGEYHYDKHHLFTYGGEHLHYTPGTEKVTVQWRGVRFRLAVCYDLRFPVWTRNDDGYDVLIYVASWPEPRAAAWSALLRARALENQCYVIGVNRTGTDPYCVYGGHSAFIDPYGNDASVIDIDTLCAFRAKFPVLKDVDRFELK